MLLAKNIPCCLPQHWSELSHVFCFFLIAVNLSSACTISSAMSFPLAFHFTSTFPIFKPTDWFSFFFFPPIDSSLLASIHSWHWGPNRALLAWVHSQECQEWKSQDQKVLDVPLQSNLSQNEGNPMVKDGCYCKSKAFLHDEASPPTPLVFSSVCYTSLLTLELS